MKDNQERLEAERQLSVQVIKNLKEFIIQADFEVNALGWLEGSSIKDVENLKDALELLRVYVNQYEWRSQ